MAHRRTPPASPQSSPGPTHSQSMGQNAHAAMVNASGRTSVSVVGGPMNFNGNPLAQQEDFTPRSYRSKSTKQG